jgi:hypothetical protein
LTLRFNKQGMWVGSQRTKLASLPPVFRNPNEPWPAIPWAREPEQPQPPTTGVSLEVGVGHAKGNWGLSWENFSVIDVRAIARNLTEFNTALPEEFPLIESIIDGINECSVHELIHTLGQVNHFRRSKYSLADFYRVLSEMGHPIKSNMIRAMGITHKRKLHSVQVIEVEGGE